MMQQEDAANAELIYGKLGDTISKVPQDIDWKNNSVKVEKKNTLAPDYYHNLGNSFLAQKRYQEAVDAYKNALRRNPGDNETRENYIYAKKKLEDGQNQDQQQQQDQNQQNQDQQNQQNQQDQQNNDQNQDQNKDQNQNNDQQQDQKDNKNDQNKDQQNNDQQQQNGNPPKISPQAAEQMLQAMQEKENQTQEKVKEEKAKALKSKQKEKNW